MAGPNGRPAPTAWRYCGNQVKLWRTDAGVTRDALAVAARYSADTVKAMEQGVRMPTRQLLDAADELCGARGKLLAAAPFLQREKFPARSQDFFAYEAEAISLWWYEVAHIPGLLQTEATVRALLNAHRPPLDDEVVEERLAARLERQAVLSRRPPAECSFVLYEAALRCPVGGADAHRQQLSHLLDVGTRRNVSIQVLPFERGAQPGLNGPMVLLETVDHEHWTLAEGQSVSLFTTNPADVSAARQRHGMIRSAALSHEESTALIKRMIGEG